jgi:predicted transcriptional regulator YdeE
MRVGNEKFDNTNYFDAALGFFGSGDDEESFKNRRIPLEPDYSSLRRELWLATDACYKQCAELYSKKEASLKNRLRTDTTPDFTLMPPAIVADTASFSTVNFSTYQDLVKKLSSIFINYPQISLSSVSAEFLPETILYVNSEGREYVKTKQMIGIEVVASTQCKDGMPIASAYHCYANSAKELPNNDSLFRATEQTAQSLVSAYEAQSLSEPYSGPILFEGQAAAEVFAQIFAPNLIAQRPPLTERGVQDNERNSAFQNKIGGRVLPEFLSVQDNPLMFSSGSSSLIGSYRIDDEGIPAQTISIIEKGYLKTLLSGRTPTKRVKTSNGHSRGGAPIFSVLHLMSVDKKKEGESEALKKRMLKLCKDRALPYGIIVKKILNINLLYTVLYEQTSGEFPYAQGDSKLTVLEAYRIYPDGKEERIRGSEIAGISPATFKDILMIGKKHHPYNYLAPAVVSAFMTGGSQFVSASLLVPDILFEDIELRPLEGDFPKPPFLSFPSALK